MQIEFIAPIIFGNFNFKNNEAYINEILISNENSHRFSFFSGPQQIGQFGLIALEKIKDNSYFYFKGESKTIQMIGDENNIKGVAAKINSYINCLTFAFWFIKDNSFITRDIYCKQLDSGFVTGAQDSRNIMNCNASGLYSSTIYKDQELDLAIELLPKIFEHLTTNEESDDSMYEHGKSLLSNTSLLSVTPYNNFDRIARALIFLQAARATSLLPQKIANYIAVLECLFTTDGTEVSFKVNQRTTLYIGGDKEEKHRNFETIKHCYSIRSKFMHGQKLENKHMSRQNLTEYSIKLDKLLRILFNKIFKSEEDIFSDDNKINGFFQNLIFR